MAKNIKVSIITVTYNSEGTIADTIASVNRQTYSNIEHIIIDGASTDRTLELIESTPNRVTKIISEPDKGIYDAMNKGIKNATGDIIGILNSDDFFTTDEAVSKIVDAFNQNKDIDAIYGDVKFVDPNNLDKEVRYYSSRVFRASLFRFGFMPAHPTFYVKRELYERYGLYSTDYKISADFELLLRFLKIHKISYKYLPACLVTMRTGGVSTKDFRNKLLMKQEAIRACKSNGVYTNFFLMSFKLLYKVYEYFLLKLGRGR